LRVAEEGARQAGRDPSSFGFAQLQNAFAWEDGDAWEIVREGAAHQIGVYGGWAEGGDTPGHGFVVSPSEEEALRRLTITGRPQDVVRALRPMIEAFASRREFHLIVRLHYPGMDFETASRAVELFGEKALPALKGS
jgi:hypothetical protein